MGQKISEREESRSHSPESAIAHPTGAAVSASTASPTCSSGRTSRIRGLRACCGTHTLMSLMSSTVYLALFLLLHTAGRGLHLPVLYFICSPHHLPPIPGPPPPPTITSPLWVFVSASSFPILLDPSTPQSPLPGLSVCSPSVSLSLFLPSW